MTKKINKHVENVKEFHRLAGQGILDKPTIPSEKIRILRARLILEEAIETIYALGVDFGVGVGENAITHSYKFDFFNFIIATDREPNLTEIADGCADITVVTTGTQLECGIPIEEVQEEVDQSNLAKFTGDYKIREDGKVIKPLNWKAPDIKSILKKHGWEG